MVTPLTQLCNPGDKEAREISGFYNKNIKGKVITKN
jgi:hypothetical protein